MRNLHFISCVFLIKPPELQLWAPLSDDSCWQVVLHQSRSTCPRQTSPHHHHPPTTHTPPPFFHLTQSGFEGSPSNARQITHLPGHQSPKQQVSFPVSWLLSINSASPRLPLSHPVHENRASHLSLLLGFFCLCRSHIWSLFHIHLPGGANRRRLNELLPDDQNSFVQLLQLWVVAC